jgi:hypothetical protein
VSGLIPLITIDHGSVPLPSCVAVSSGRLKMPVRTSLTAVSSPAGEDTAREAGGPQIIFQSDYDTYSVVAASTAGLECIPAVLTPGR